MIPPLQGQPAISYFHLLQVFGPVTSPNYERKLNNKLRATHLHFDHEVRMWQGYWLWLPPLLYAASRLPRKLPPSMLAVTAFFYLAHWTFHPLLREMLAF
jgi:hypothetical protein